MEKKGIFAISVFIILIFLLSINFVLSDSGCDDSQTILKLYSTSNSHAEVYDGSSNYPIRICYSDIFGSQYQGANPHTCKADRSNVVLRLSGETNAHAEAPDQTTPGYIDVCYGNLICSLKTTCDESAGEKEVVSLYSETNSHLASDGSYNNKLCCKPGAKLTNLYWANMFPTENEISSTNKSDTVKLIAEGTELENQEVQFKIFKSGDNTLIKTIPPVISSGRDKVSVTWIAGTDDDGNLNSGNFYFTAKLTSTGQELTSPEISVSEEEENSPPVAVITEPYNGQINKTGEEVQFSHASYDVDDEISTVEWNFGDNSGTSSEDSPTHAYSEKGGKQIILTVTDSRGKQNSDSVSILIVPAGNPTEPTYYAFANISKPSYDEWLNNNLVEFDGTGSYVFEYMPDGSYNCTAGICPQGVLNSPQPIDNLNFSWIFDVGNSIQGMGKSDVWSIFGYGDHTADLTVSYITPNSEEITSDPNHIEFKVYSETPFCSISSNGKNSYWNEGGVILDSSGDCYRDNGLPTIYCCPNSYTCQQQTDNSWMCKITGETTCFDYKTKDACNNYNPRVAEQDVNSRLTGGRQCGMDHSWEENGVNYFIGDCRCQWNSTANNGNGLCEAAWTLSNWSGPTITPTGSCTFSTTTQTECIAGTRTVSWDASWQDHQTNQPDFCTAGSVQVPCLSTAPFGFFGLTGIIATIIIITIFYITKIKKENEK